MDFIVQVFPLALLHSKMEGDDGNHVCPKCDAFQFQLLDTAFCYKGTLKNDNLLPRAACCTWIGHLDLSILYVIATLL